MRRFWQHATGRGVGIMVGILLVLAGMGCGGGGAGGGAVYGPENSNGSKGRFTIVLGQYTQSDRVEQAQALVSQAKRVLGSDEIWLSNDEETGLSVNYGRFETNTPGSEVQREYERVKEVYEQLDPGAYQFPFIKEIDRPGPKAPSKWDLLNSDCLLTLEIATYYDVAEENYYDRKADAVKAVKSLREAGETAYFVHGEYQSRVFVGCIGVGDEAESEGIAEEIKALQKKHPYRYENSAKVYDIRYDQTGRRIRIPRKSELVEVDLLREEVAF